MSFYLDTNFVVSLLLPEPFSLRAEAFAEAHLAELVISDFGSAEFLSAMARRVRNREMAIDDARVTIADFDAWSGRATLRVQIHPLDVAQANAYLRRLDLPLRTPDAIHIAMAQRIGAALVTFDRRMISSAEILGIPVAAT